MPYTSRQYKMEHTSGELRRAIRTGGATRWPALASAVMVVRLLQSLNHRNHEAFSTSRGHGS